jgi:hypothetical protein
VGEEPLDVHASEQWVRHPTQFRHLLPADRRIGLAELGSRPLRAGDPLLRPAPLRLERLDGCLEFLQPGASNL